jgi:hypothetical protein
VTLPHHRQGGDHAGLGKSGHVDRAELRSDVLDKVDVDFDIGHARLNLFSRDHCANQVIYWTRDPAAMIPFLMDNEGRPTIMVELDGKRVRAALDTSTTRSYLVFSTAHRLFDLDEASAGLTKDSGDGTYLDRFNTISLEGVTINHPEVSLCVRRAAAISPGRRRICRSA